MMRKYVTGILFGVISVVPVIGLLSLGHELIGNAHLPVEWLHATFGLAITDMVLSAEQTFVMVPYFVWGLLVSTIAYVRLSQRDAPVRRIQGVMVGLLFGLPLILIVMILAPLWPWRLLAFLVLGLLFAGWGLAYRYAVNRLAFVEQPDMPMGRLLGRRDFLILGSVALTTVASGWASSRLVRERRERLRTHVQIPNTFPATLTAKVYPVDATAFQFPEQQFARYQPSQSRIGVCFSGGGPRAASAALGQMRGLYSLGLLDSIGAISCVSGGAWLGTIFSYAPAGIDDGTLLGAVLEPEALSVANLSAIDPNNIGAPIITMTDDNMLKAARNVMRSISLSGTAAFDRFYSRLLNEFLLLPFQIGQPHTFFTLDDQTIQDILTRNPGLKPENFYTMRPNRPYMIVGGAQVYPPGANQVLRSFEFTPLYTGMPQLFAGAGNQGASLGGGYVETFAFDTIAPVNFNSGGLVTVSTPEPIFLLSDMLGSTSAGPGAMLSHYQVPNLMPQFQLWSLASPDQTAFLYSVVDGASVENVGIIPLLRRQYPVILAFVNGPLAVGANDPSTISGIDQQISRLFGVLPDAWVNVDQNAQIFPTAQFEALANGLNQARQNGDVPMYVDEYEIVQPNPFGVAGYAGKVKVVWFYNDLNESWLNKLPAEVMNLLNSTDPINRMDNFPHFNTIGQNKTDDGVPQIFYYSAQQINLLAHMWSYGVMHGARDVLMAL